MTRRHNRLGSVSEQAVASQASPPTALHVDRAPASERKRAARREPERTRRAIDGIVVARLLALGPDGKAMVQVVDPAGLDQRLQQPIVATAVAALTPGHLGRRVALLFERGDPGRPIVMAPMHEAAPQEPATSDAVAPAPVTVALDADELQLEARRQVVLSCGKASITLTRAGKIILHGTYVVSRSSGVNRIKGGSVQIN